MHLMWMWTWKGMFMFRMGDTPKLCVGCLLLEVRVVLTCVLLRLVVVFFRYLIICWPLCDSGTANCPWSTGYNGASGLVVDRATGSVYVANNYQNTICRVSSAGGALSCVVVVTAIARVCPYVVRQVVSLSGLVLCVGCNGT